MSLSSWSDTLEPIKQKPYFKNIMTHVDEARHHGLVFPPSHAVFNAFKQTPFESLKAVIIGQDPYHGPNQANGLCFSVNKGIKIPPSLRNIFKELHNDLNIPAPSHGDLTAWAQQGVLLLNSTLTVNQGEPQSHANFGWQPFTSDVIQSLNQHPSPLVFFLWGAYAQKKGADINCQQHCILTAPHPSPLSAHRGFLGCQHFSIANQWLEQKGVSPIKWQLDD